MTFVPFAMERYQSTWEHEVDLNLSESGVHPLRLGELLELLGIDRPAFEAIALEYVQSNGSAALRERIAAFHPGASPDNVVVTNGSAEANFIAAWWLCRPHSNIVFLEPNYFQIHGLARNLGSEVREWWLRPDQGWEPDLEALAGLVDDTTSAIVVTNPHNPTARRFPRRFLDGVVEVAARHGCWILADEVYRGAERDGVETPTFWGAYDRLIVTGGLSKAYGLPGLRLGWLVAAPDTAAQLWARKDYTTISPGAVSEYLARHCLRPDARDALLERTRAIVRSNWTVLREFLDAYPGVFEYRAPEAGAIAFVRYDLPLDSFELSERLRTEVGCLLVPGAHFRTPEYLRIGFGPPVDRLAEGLERFGRLIDGLR